MIVIPVDALSAEALQGVIEAFVYREGTDYGEVEVEFATKVAQVRALLASGEALIVYDEESESTSIIDKQQLPPDAAALC